MKSATVVCSVKIDDLIARLSAIKEASPNVEVNSCVIQRGNGEILDLVTETYFGVCPTCHMHDGYINIGKGHWFFCKEHSVCWLVGSNLFSDAEYESEEEQRRIYDELHFQNFRRLDVADV